jgi:hypothetical protein
VQEIQVCSNKGSVPLQREDNYKNIEMVVGSFNNRLLKNHWTNFNQTWNKSSLGNGIQVSSNEGDCCSRRGGKRKRVKIQ